MRAVAGSQLIAQENVARFAGEVADAIRLELAEQVEAGDWYGAIRLGSRHCGPACHQARSPARARQPSRKPGRRSTN